MVKKSDRISAYAASILAERDNRPMYIREIREELGKYLKQAYLPNPRGLSNIFSNSGDFLIEGPLNRRTYRLRPDVYKKSKRRPAGS